MWNFWAMSPRGVIYLVGFLVALIPILVRIILV
jgi:hypothetical protein